MTKVAKATPLSPNRRVNSAVARDAAKMFTRLLPSRTEPISRSLSSVIRKARSAPADPLSAWTRSLPRDAAVSAVSEPEKNPERTSRNKMIADRNPECCIGRCLWQIHVGNLFLDVLSVMGGVGAAFKEACA